MHHHPKRYSNVYHRTWIQSLTGVSTSLQNQRSITSFLPDLELPSNHIHTSKYTWYNFIPNNLYQQFKKLPNIYFLIIGIFQIIPYTSNTDTIPTIYIPLFLIFFITGIRDLYEDYKRQISDKNENSLIYSIIQENGQANPIKSSDIYPGMVIRINNGDMIPCDGLIVYSPSQITYCNTKNLDGESNLKKKIFLPELSSKITVMQDGIVLLPQLKLDYQKPNTMMNAFRGVISFSDQILPISEKNICLRSSYLMNSKFIYILSLYTGHDTKILLSMNSAKYKTTNLERKMYILIISIAITVFILSICFAFLTRRTSQRLHLYVFGNSGAPQWQVVTDAFTWILNITNLIPISLIFTLQTVKFCEGKLMEYSSSMKTEQFSTIVNASSLIQELGEIQYIASDKTGTLTKNSLVLRKISDGFNTYTQNEDVPKQLSLFVMISHQVYVNQNSYEGVSLDEVSILNFFKLQDKYLVSRSTKQMTINIKNQLHSVKIIDIIQFSSDRKRQSIIVFFNSKYYIVCKGADDVIIPKMCSSSSLNLIKKQIQKFSEQGLRTLIYGYRELQQQEALSWVSEYNQKKMSGIEDLQFLDLIQKEFTALCCTGIQDELADNAQEIVQKILDADIKFMIISGDKPETVIAIAKSISNTVEPFLSETNQYKEEYNSKPFVVFSRCTPKQKQQIVSKIKGKVLAIGDGANDVSMLTKAHVGVGINGKQGKAAVQSSDFGIPSFKFLDRLIFHYGLRFNKNNSILIRYNFYKNFLFTFPLIIFGFYSFSSGVYLYNSYIAQLFNLLFTSIPIGAYTLFQDSLEFANSLQEARQYKKNRENSLFTVKHLILDVLQSAGQSILCSFLCFQLLPTMLVSPNDLNIYEISSVLLLFIVVASNVYLLMITKRFYLGIVISVVFGIGCFVLCYKVITSFQNSDIIKQSFLILSKPPSLIMIILNVTLGIMISVIVHFSIQILLNGKESIKKQKGNNLKDPIQQLDMDTLDQIVK